MRAHQEMEVHVLQRVLRVQELVAVLRKVQNAAVLQTAQTRVNRVSFIVIYK